MITQHSLQRKKKSLSRRKASLKLQLMQLLKPRTLKQFGNQRYILVELDVKPNNIYELVKVCEYGGNINILHPYITKSCTTNKKKA